MYKTKEAYQHKKEYVVKYARAHYKRVPLDVTFEQFETIKAAAAKSGESVNGFIKKAITERIAREFTCNE